MPTQTHPNPSSHRTSPFVPTCLPPFLNTHRTKSRRPCPSNSTPAHPHPPPPTPAQLLSAVCYLHDRWVMHRDLKLSNLLFTHSGQLKLCDYGLARYFQPWAEAYTPGVVTLWYR